MSGLLFLETALFRKWTRKNRLTAAVARLRGELTLNPIAGDVIPASVGLRKIRMAGGGRGKRGGFRVVYVLMVKRQVAVILDGYAKSEKEDVTAEQLERLIVLSNLMRPIAEKVVAENAESEGEEQDGENQGESETA